MVMESGFRGGRLTTSSLVRKIRRWVTSKPSIYIPLKKRLRRDAVVNEETSLVIEGFPRSGNTWTEALVRSHASRPVCLAHHTHAVAHVLHAITLKKPVLLLIRNPDDAVLSFLRISNYRLSLETAYKDYADFYKRLLKTTTSPLVKVFSFETVTGQPIESLHEIGEHGGLTLAEVSKDPELLKERVYAWMDQKAKVRRGDNDVQSFARPKERDDARELEVKALLAESSLASYRAAAFDIYQKYLNNLAL